ncbi:hypothetical protein [Saccharothrix yanglingensis]|uniref:DUF1877 family protein n=1 Tax=Saccharothrix yanglingensis TaxID=659496 RepID=A0ABU0X9K1_9PSEU|nr:hypothetical protein [Saccharothrix yanglingensis]MDQ2588817.1 hypothetical protein [Saccharothrix yanglingensis]
MGVPTDYFHAPDAATVARAVDAADGYPVVGGVCPAFVGVEAKGVDPDVLLGQLVAAIAGGPWRPGLVAQSIVWPTTRPPGPQGPEDDDDPWATGPWVVELDTATRDALAGADPADAPRLAAEWACAEEFGDGTRGEDLAPLVAELLDLARRARDRGERLYCWSSL